MRNQPFTRSAKSDADGMSLPAGCTCFDCIHFRRCSWLFQCSPKNEVCDWAPSRFRPSIERRGFTLVELLIVIVIIGLITAVALPPALSALSHRQVTEAARLLQGAISACRDRAVLTGAPSGLRLIPDPAFPVAITTTGLDGTQPLAFSRMIPIEPPGNYTTGRVDIPDPSTLPTTTSPVLVLVERVVAPNAQGLVLPNEPTSWFWNVRVGDKLQIGTSGIWYTVCGPVGQSNPEGFVNVGPPGTASTLPPIDQNGYQVQPEFLYLVNGLDDNRNGWIDEGYDGVDNNGDNVVDNPGLPTIVNPVNPFGEWEPEAWPAGTIGTSNSAYTIQRRPAPTSNARELSLPTNVVIDASTWSAAIPTRSRLPIDPTTGTVEILVRPDGSMVLQTRYGVPTSVSLDSSFLHFWLAERSDVGLATPAGEWAIVSAFCRTGRTVTTSNPPIGDPFSAIQQGQK